MYLVIIFTAPRYGCKNQTKQLLTKAYGGSSTSLFATSALHAFSACGLCSRPNRGAIATGSASTMRCQRSASLARSAWVRRANSLSGSCARCREGIARRSLSGVMVADSTVA